jgi:hypothetical protein
MARSKSHQLSLALRGGKTVISGAMLAGAAGRTDAARRGL